MSSPRTGDWVMLKQLAKYLKQHPRLVSHYAWKMSGPMTVYSDTDWAGCERTRRSTSGGAVLLGGALMRSWSSTQATVALSSAEAELQGMVKAAAEGIGMQSLLADLGRRDMAKRKFVVYGDASAALGIAARQGAGRVRHLDTRLLWIQDKAAREAVDFKKISRGAARSTF